MRRKRRQDGESSEAEINLTALIDVVFVVLIMFILVAPMLEIDRVQLAQAAPSSEKEMAVVQENGQITIHVRSDNKVLFNKREVTVAQLTSLLKEAKKRHPKQVPQLFNDKKAYFETYQMIKNAVENAGFEEMDVVLQPG